MKLPVQEHERICISVRNIWSITSLLFQTGLVSRPWSSLYRLFVFKAVLFQFISCLWPWAKQITPNCARLLAFTFILESIYGCLLFLQRILKHSGWLLVDVIFWNIVPHTDQSHSYPICVLDIVGDPEYIYNWKPRSVLQIILWDNL